MGQVISSDGTQIAFDRIGDGPAIIMVDGANAYRAINPVGAQVAAMLSPRFTVFTYDRRGRGQSTDNADEPAEDREIEDLAALISEAGGSAFVFGGSSGAMLAMDAAARGLGIEKLAVYEAPLRVDSSFHRCPGTIVRDSTSSLRKVVTATQASCSSRRLSSFRSRLLPR